MNLVCGSSLAATQNMVDRWPSLLLGTPSMLLNLAIWRMIVAFVDARPPGLSFVPGSLSSVVVAVMHYLCQAAES